MTKYSRLEDANDILVDTGLSIQDTNIRKNLHRLEPLDTLRGVIIIVMAVDHISALSGPRIAGEVWSNNTIELAGTDFNSVMLFITRFITHICAIGFFFLMGLGMVFLYHSRQRAGWSRFHIIRHFVIRGLVLIVLQFIWEDVVWTLSQWTSYSTTTPKRYVLFFGILQALGLSMIITSIFLVIDNSISRKIVIKRREISVGTIILALGSIFCTVLTAIVIHYADPNANYNPLLRLLLIAGQWKQALFFDCTIPWVGVTLWGTVHGKLFHHLGNENNDKRFNYLLLNGVIFWIMFAFERILGLSVGFWFGNFRLPEHYNNQQYAAAVFSLSKYPPSLSFICLFLGTNMILAWIIHKTRFNTFSISRAANVFGKSSLFFYCAHLWVYLLLGYLFNRSRFNLPIYYAYPTWCLGLVILYPMCVMFSNYKHKQNYDSIWKLF